jgi:putative hemolysin
MQFCIQEFLRMVIEMDFLLLLFLILLNGLFSMSEIAVITARQARLKQMADEGERNAQAALDLHNEPSNFLSAIQVGITTVGILSGAIGEKSLGYPLMVWFSQFPFIEPYARGIAFTVVVIGLTFFTVVIGELVPKQLGLLAPEKVAKMIAPVMNTFSRLTLPLVWLLSSASKLLLRMLGSERTRETPVSNEEIKVMMEQGTEAGVFHASEPGIVSNVLRLDEQRIGSIMTPRNEIYTLDLTESVDEIRKRIAESPYTRIVVCRDGLDHIAGILRTQDILLDVLAGKPLQVEAYLRSPLYLPEGVTTAHLLENFRSARQQCALIVDEYGETQGFVTLTDVLISIVGEIPTSDILAEQDVVMREDGSWLIDGSVTIDRLKSVLDIKHIFPEEGKNKFNSLGGLVMHVLDRIPLVNDRFDLLGYQFEVVDMDKNRVDKMLVMRVAQTASAPGNPVAKI